jgi:hypothetical protein
MMLASVTQSGPPVAGGARIGARTVGADAKARAVEMQDRAAPRRDGVDLHHGGAHAHARNNGFERALVRAVVKRNVGRRAAHVEADDLGKAGRLAGARGPHDAARRAGEDRILALEPARIDKPAVGLHEQQPRFAERRRDAIDIAAQNRRNIRIDHGRIAAPDDFHQRRDFVADRDLRKPDAPCDRRQHRFVRRIAITVHQHDRKRVDTACERAAQIGFGFGFVECLQHVAVGVDTLVDFDCGLVEQLGQFDASHK